MIHLLILPQRIEHREILKNIIVDEICDNYIQYSTTDIDYYVRFHGNDVLELIFMDHFRFNELSIIEDIQQNILNKIS